MTDNNNLEEYYEHTYACDKCKEVYGSDKKEKDKHTCPMCEGKLK